MCISKERREFSILESVIAYLSAFSELSKIGSTSERDDLFH